eukprot:c7661_g1_i1.p1 GENE.c7661_g1_i1~~c7661_g1_i1.p1  ORF type:complete len:460 (+),score=139.73 c7661_g1_i1:89-1381(+)
MLGKKHQDTTNSLNGMANLCIELKDFQSAYGYSCESLDVRIQTLGAHHNRTSIASALVANVCMKLKRTEEARALLMLTLEGWFTMFGSNGKAMQTPMQQLAQTFEAEKREDQLDVIVNVLDAAQVEAVKSVVKTDLDLFCALQLNDGEKPLLVSEYHRLSRTPQHSNLEQGKCRLNQLLREANLPELEPSVLQQLADALPAAKESRISPTENAQPIIITAPHSIFLKNLDSSIVQPEDYTQYIARALASDVNGTSITWSLFDTRRVWMTKKAFILDPSQLGTECSWNQALVETLNGFEVPTLHLDVHGVPDQIEKGISLACEISVSAVSEEDLAFKNILQEQLTSCLKSFEQLWKVVVVDSVAEHSGLSKLSVECRSTATSRHIAVHVGLSQKFRVAMVCNRNLVTAFGRTIQTAWDNLNAPTTSTAEKE